MIAKILISLLHSHSSTLLNFPDGIFLAEVPGYRLFFKVFLKQIELFYNRLKGCCCQREVLTKLSTLWEKLSD